MNEYDKIVLANLSADIDVHSINMKCWTKSYIDSVYEPRFAKIEDRMNRLERWIGGVEYRLDRVENEVVGIKNEIGSVKNILIQILNRLDKLEFKSN